MSSSDKGTDRRVDLRPLVKMIDVYSSSDSLAVRII